jgi:hypothetical protein
VVPDSLNPEPDTDPDPAFQVSPDPNPNPDPGFDDQKLETNLQLKILFIFFGSKIAIYFSLGLHKGRPGYRTYRTSKDEILPYWIRMGSLNPDPDPGTPSNPYPIWTRIHNTVTKSISNYRGSVILSIYVNGVITMFREKV